jgi:hypothetical protein
MLAAASLAILLALVALLIATPRRKDPAASELKPPPALRLSPLALLLLGSWAVVGMLALHLIDPDLLASWLGHGAEMTAQPPLPRDVSSGPDMIQVPVVNLGVAVALVSLAAVIIGFALLVILLNEPWTAIAGWFRRPRRSGRPGYLDDLASAISAAAHELELGGDPRYAVIACYRRCETAFAVRRRRRYSSETPREFVYDALTALVLPANAVRSLLSVFERARFSDLPITQRDQSIALDALHQILSALEGGIQDEARA